MIRSLLVAGAAMTAIVGTAFAVNKTGALPEGYVATGETVQCLNGHNIKKVHGLDGYTLVVKMRTGDVYRAVLPNRCPGLRQNRTVSWSSGSESKLCSSSTIRVQTVGSTLRDHDFGGTMGCALARFELLEKSS